MKSGLVIAAVCVACTGRPPNASAPPATLRAPMPSCLTPWLFMGDTGIPIPLTCAATCDLQSDVWVGAVQCGAVSVRLYGGFTSMAAMALNKKGATVEAQSALSHGGTLRLGVASGEFCASILDGEWNWEICGSDDPTHRQEVLEL